jgi:hypothetical protein
MLDNNLEEIPKDVPVLIALPYPHDGLSVWCPFCKGFHVHSPEEGMREAHCEDGPLAGKRYYVIMMAHLMESLQ